MMCLFPHQGVYFSEDITVSLQVKSVLKLKFVHIYISDGGLSEIHVYT